MSTIGNPDNIKIERVSLEWSSQEVSKIDLTSIDGNTGSVSGAGGFNIFSKDDAVVGRVWFNDTTQSNTDPSDPGETAIEVTYDSTVQTSSASVAAIMATAIDGQAGFYAKVDACDPNCVVVMNEEMGSASDIADRGIAASGVLLSTLLQGDSFSLGFTDDFEMPAGGLELADISALQNGTTVIQRLRSGRNLEAISVPMKESDAAKLQEFLASNGDVFTPAGGSQVHGLGTSKLGEGVLKDSRRLRIHPLRLDDATRTEDFYFWRAFPSLGNIAFSAESEQIVNVEFSLLPDPLITDEVAHMVYGDWQQNFLK